MRLIWRSPYILLVIATCLWGGNFVIGKMLVLEVPPFSLALLRWLIALLVVMPLFSRNLWRQRAVFIKHWKTVVFLAITGVAGFNTIVYIAVQYTDSINASLMNSATPMMIVLLAMIFLREAFSWQRGVGIVISLLGVLWIVCHGSWFVFVTLSFNRGDLWMVLAVLLWAMYSIGVRKVSSIFPANELLLLTITISVFILLLCSFSELTFSNRSIHWTFGTVFGILYIGLFASLVAFSCWNKAVALIGPSRSAIFLNLIPLFSALFATLFMGEHIRLYHGIGAFLIISGVYVTTKKTKQPKLSGKL